MKKEKITIIFIIISILISFTILNRVLNSNTSSKIIQETAISNIKTEKAGMPYINPQWEEYMQLSEEEKANINIIPEKYIYNYIPTDNLYGDYSTLPRKFNLRDNYATPIKDQGREGLCWSYATLSTIESNLKVRKNIDKEFSAHQLSSIVSGTKIPTSLNMEYGEGIKYTSEIGFHNSILASGFVPVEDENYDGELNVEDVTYFIKNTVMFPDYENNESYRNMMKSYIKNYGAIYIATTVADSRSGNFYNSEYNLLDVHYNSRNYEDAIPSGAGFAGHAMIIIGWDDDYGPDSDGDGKPDGAWLLQNSWGDKNLTKAFPYISYNSEINYLRGIKIIEDKNWDNNYTMALNPTVKITGEEIEQEKSYFEGIDFDDSDKYNKLLNNTAVKGSVEVGYAKHSTKEKLKYINFTSASQNSTYRIYVNADGDTNSYTLIKQLKTDMPGLYTVDVDDVELPTERFIIKIETDDGAIYTQINAFTSNVEEKPEKYAYMEKCDEPREYLVYFHANDLNQKLNYIYKIKDENGTEIEDAYDGISIGRFNNSLIRTIYIPKEVKVGSEITVELYLETDLDNPILEITKIYSPNAKVNGQGTEIDPFIIKNKEDFKTIFEYQNAYYKLDSDIDFSDSDEIKEMDFKFYGVLDGNGHKLLNYSNTKPLFTNINNAKIYNIVLENFEVNSSNTTAGLLSKVINNSDIEDILVIGNVKGTNAGLLAGEGSRNILKNLFLNGKISGSAVGAIFGISKESNNISNCVIISNYNSIKSSDTYYVVSGLIGRSGATNSVSNCYMYLNSLNYKNNKNLKFNLLYSGAKEKNEINNINAYCVEGEEITFEDSDFVNESNNVTIFEDFDEFKNINLENMFLDSDKWEILDENIYPTLKEKKFYFITDVNVDKKIRLGKNKDYKIDANIVPKNASNKNLTYKIKDAEIATIDENGNVIANNEGKTEIIVSTTDGSNISKNILLNVSDDYIKPYKINTYDCNEENKTISNIFPTTIEHYLENINIESPYYAKILKNNEEVKSGNIATGMVTKIYLEDEVVAEYVNIVPGDIYEDGIVNSRDAGMLVQYLVGMRDEMYGTYQYYACDFSRDGKVKLNDVELIKQYVVHMYTPSEEDYYGQNN